MIVPVYNSDLYLEKCLDSILAQTHTDLDIILIDDGSVDSSGSLCDAYAALDNRIRVFHTENCGPSAARNTGLNFACGDWITFVDSDDIVQPDLCHYLLSLAVKYNAGLVQCGAIWSDTKVSKKIFAPDHDRIFAKGVHEFDPDAWFCFSNVNWGKLYRSDIIRHIRFDPQYMIGEDLHFNFRALATSCCVVLGFEAKYHYIQTPHSLFRAKPSREKLLSCRTMLENAHDEFRSCDAILSRVADEKYRNALDICSKIVTFQLKSEQDVCFTVRGEIKSHLRQLLTSPSFSQSEKIKFFLIARVWPIYCKLLLWSKLWK